jgi:hypothetical protein
VRILGALVVAVSVSVSVSSASAGPAADSYAQSMAEGARRMAANDAAGAVVAFQAALEARPHDARALSELAWASFSAGDLAAASSLASEAVVVAKSPRVRAMAYYNLGRASEALGRLTGAQIAYARSLALRDNAEVRARLNNLSTALLTAHPLAGPFARPDAFCASPCEVVPDIDHRLDESGQELVDLAGNIVHEAKPPFLAVTKLVTDAPGPAISFPIANLALQVGSSWYVLPSIGEAAGGHGGRHAIDVKMVGPRLVATWTSEVGRFGHVDEVATIVCGVGASGRPSCVGPIVTEWSNTEDHCGKSVDCTTRPTLTVELHCRAELRGDTLVVTRNPARIENPDDAVRIGPRPGACEALPMFGKHALSF